MILHRTVRDRLLVVVLGDADVVLIAEARRRVGLLEGRFVVAARSYWTCPV